MAAALIESVLSMNEEARHAPGGDPVSMNAQDLAALAAELEALAKMPDSQIDFGDVPPLDDAFWKHATRNPFYKPTKTSTTVRVDSDVLAWLKSQGKGYQRRLNAILRSAMLDQKS